jgi:predicted ribonuclease YlaK
VEFKKATAQSPRCEEPEGRYMAAGISPKTFILDTNVILHDATCIHQFKENDIVIPLAVIEEIDHFKGQRLYAHMNLEKGERSELADLASNLL